MTREIGREFMEKTKYQHLEESEQDKGLPQPPLEAEYDDKAVLIDLPPVDKIKVKNIDLRDVIESRKTVRKYGDTSLTIEELSYLLWCTQGVKQIVSRPATLRNVPSAGARHAFETYLYIRKVDGITSGLYRYLAIEHKLIEVNLESKVSEKLTISCENQKFIENNGVTFIWTASSYRMKWRYGERGYRYIHLDAGHVCQNLYLSAETVDCGVCAMAAFDDDKINDLLGLDGENDFVVYIASLGKKPNV